MSRELPPGLEQEIAKAALNPFLAVFVDLPDPVRAWTGIGTIGFKGAEWTGAGGVGAIDGIGEATDGSATGVKCTLNKIPTELRMDVERQAVKGAAFEIYIGALDETYSQVKGFKLVWKGRLDTYKIIDGGDTLTVEITGESRAIDQRRPAIKRFTDEYQQRRHPGDKFFEYVPQMAEIPILWAKAEQGGAVVGGGGGGGGGLPNPNVRQL